MNSSSKPFTVLIVDDNEEASEALCNLITSRIPLSRCNHAENLKDGIRLANEGDANDMTLLDVLMPGSTIDEVVQSIPLFPEPVIMITSLDDPTGILEDYCWAYGAANFFDKQHLLGVIDVASANSLSAELKKRRLISSICSAYKRKVMPRRRSQFTGGIGHLFTGQTDG